MGRDGAEEGGEAILEVGVVGKIIVDGTEMKTMT